METLILKDLILELTASWLLIEKGLHPWKSTCVECREPTYLNGLLYYSKGRLKNP